MFLVYGTVSSLDLLKLVITYETRTEMQKALQMKGDEGRSYKHASLETWQFVHEIKPGDVIFAKRGQHEIIGRGIVESDYYYDDTRDGPYKNLRQVKWTHKGSWAHPEGSAITKLLTDVTSYTDYGIDQQILDQSLHTGTNSGVVDRCIGILAILVITGIQGIPF